MSAAAAELRPWVAGLTADLSHPPRIELPWEPRSDRMLLDLALQAAGAVSVPRPPTDGGAGEAPEPDGTQLDATLDLPAMLPAALDLERPAPDPQPPAGDILEDEAREPVGGVRVLAPDGTVLDLTAAELRGLVGAFAAEVLGGAGPEPSLERPIWVQARPLSDFGERLVSTWALTVGAATVLASPDTHVAIAAWVRPSLLSGDPAEVTALVEAAKSYKPPFPRGLSWRLRAALRRRLRPAAEPIPPPPPFDRLHTVLVRWEEEGAAADLAAGLPGPVAAFLRERGTRIASLPVHPDAALWRRSYNIRHRGGNT